MADYNISYDPCGCYFESVLTFGQREFKSANIEIKRQLEGTIEVLNSFDINDTDRLLSFYKTHERQLDFQVNNGLFIYKNYEKLIRDFKELEDNTNTYENVFEASKAIADIAKSGYNVNSGNQKSLKALQTISKFTGFASMPFKTAKPTRSLPVLIPSHVSLLGQLNQGIMLGGSTFSFFTPGSYTSSTNLALLNAPNNADRFDYPVYNQAMGLYALLATPTKEVAVSHAEMAVKAVGFLRKYGNSGITPNDSITQSIAFSPREVFKLDRDLSYTFNPSAQINFEATKMEAAWMVEVDNLANNDLWLFTSQNMSKTYTYVNSENRTITVYSSTFIPFECISQFMPVFDFDLTNKAKKTNYQYPPFQTAVPAWWLGNHLKKHVGQINNDRPKIVNTYLKLNITYRYNKPNGGGLNDIVHFETYKYEIEGNTLNKSLLVSPNIDALSAPSELIIENRNFTANETIFAWDKITLKGKISSKRGVIVKIKSAGEIVVEPNAEIDSDITLLIGNPSLCNPVRIQPTVIDSSYCKNTKKYKANSILDKTKILSHPSTLNYNVSQSIIYPNPTSEGNFTVETILAIESFVNISINDLTGKLVYKQQMFENLSQGKHKFEFNNLFLENGLFLVEVETNEGTMVYKLIKN